MPGGIRCHNTIVRAERRIKKEERAEELARRCLETENKRRLYPFILAEALKKTESKLN